MQGVDNSFVASSGRTRFARVAAAFTLIELLLTIAVIALLAALILGSLGAAREAGRRVACASSTRQVALAMAMYADDNAGYLPPFFGGTIILNGSGNGIHYKIHTAGKWALPVNVGPLGTPRILLCGSDRNPAVISTADLNGNNLAVPDSYAYNYELYLTGTRVAAVEASKLLLIMDGVDTNNLQTGVWYANINPSKKHQDIDRFNSSIVARRHSKRFNGAFLDAHVEWLTGLSNDMLLPDWQ